MAEVRIEDGKITRVFHEGRGMEVAESWTVKGKRSPGSGRAGSIRHTDSLRDRRLRSSDWLV